MNPKRKYIIPALVVVILGALVGREYPVAGYWTVVAGFGSYTLTGCVPMIGDLRNFRHLSNRGKARVISWAVMLGVLVSVLWSGRPLYFSILLMLAVEYLLYENKPKR